MGRKFKKLKKNQDIDQRDEKKQDFSKEYFEYYRIQLQEYFKDEEEFEKFKFFSKKELPTSFRFNPFISNHKLLLEKLDKLKQKHINTFVEQNEKPKFKFEMNQIKWYPNSLIYEINMEKTALKKNEKLNEIHQFINHLNNSGFVYRQELVSMIPPLFLDVQKDDLILDMCAAPGSKTSQILEFLQKNQQGLLDGGVIANELDYKRAWILSHQVKKIKIPNIAVINHPGQFIPNLKKDKQIILFDKILVDTPCSGDGAIRKLPERWQNYNPLDGNNLHFVQVQLLTRAIKMLKKGGICVYSTCSLNAIENEAVVTEILKNFNEKEITLELQDVHGQLGNFKLRQGLDKWSVLSYNKDENDSNDLYHVFENYQQVQKQFQNDEKLLNKFGKSMFPLSKEEMKKIQIQKTARILPHDNNSGGFFISVIKKIEQNDNEENILKEEDKLNKKIKNNKSSGFFQTEEYTQIDKDLIKELKEEFQFKENFPFEQLICHVKSNRKISIVSKKIKEFFENDPQRKINQIYSGTCVFQQNKQKEGVSQWRLSNEGIQFIKPYLKSNIIKVSKELFLFMIKQSNSIDFKSFPNELKTEVDQLKALKNSSYCLTLEKNIMNEDEEIFVILKMNSSIVLMISKEDLIGLSMKYD